MHRCVYTELQSPPSTQAPSSEIFETGLALDNAPLGFPQMLQVVKSFRPDSRPKLEAPNGEIVQTELVATMRRWVDTELQISPSTEAQSSEVVQTKIVAENAPLGGHRASNSFFHRGSK